MRLFGLPLDPRRLGACIGGYLLGELLGRPDHLGDTPADIDVTLPGPL
jgi:hypothetical protein